jgi:hypothetical protein
VFPPRTLSLFRCRLVRLWRGIQRHAQRGISAACRFPLIKCLVSRFVGHGATVSDATPEAPTPTFMDHYFLQFWLWAFITDAEAFLQASGAFRAAMRTRITPSMPQDWVKQRSLNRMNFDRAKYHFVSTMGSLLRHLRRTHSLFPAIQTAWEKAEHLQKEGKDLRDMIEHADQYMAGEGRKQDKFVRDAEGVAMHLPGDKPGRADATSLIVDGNGHWLGGRFNVEHALLEVRAIWAEAEKIPSPQPSRPRRGGPIR